MTSSSRKAELLKTVDQLTIAGTLYDGGLTDETSALREIFTLSQKLAYLSQTPVEWAQRIITQPALNCALRVAIEAKWFGVLADGKAKTATQIAEATRTQTGLLIRMMRLLTCEGLVDEVGINQYRANEQTRYFMVPVHADMAKTWFDNLSGPLAKLPEYLVNINFHEPSDDSVGPYAFTYGMTSWKRFVSQPAIGETFNKAMTYVKRHGRCPLVDKYPLIKRMSAKLPASDDEVLIVDIAGGLGYHLRQFRSDEPGEYRGRLILQDQPHVLPSPTHEPDVAALLANAAIETMEYDFFMAQPVKGALIYHLSAIIHNWPDSLALRILRAQVSAMRRYHSRLLIHDYVLPDTGASTMQVGFDVTMMAVLCGKERSLGEWKNLLASVGLGIVGIWGEGGINELSTIQAKGKGGEKVGEAGSTKIIECDFWDIALSEQSGTFEKGG